MMKYRWMILLLCVFALTGCAKSGKIEPSKQFKVHSAQTEIALGAPAAPILEALGAPFGYAENKSGIYSGVEKTYRFSGLNLRTYQSEDGDRILGMLITDKSLQTTEGIAIGDTADRVRECYGQDAIQDGHCVVRSNSGRMVLMLKNDVVTAIQYSLV